MLTFWAFIVLLFTLYMCALTYRAFAQLGNLKDTAPSFDDGELTAKPTVSVIIPACNEAENLEETVASLLAQDYGPLEIIVINDRSTDETGRVLELLAEKQTRVKGIHIHDLPEGMLGKNHAMHAGSSIAAGEYLLFTDADIRFEPTTLTRAMHHVQQHRLDHLTLLFRNTTPGGLLNAVIVEAMTGLLLLLQPWKVSDPGSKFFIGIGAFNLVRKEAYQAIGGHEANPMHPIDDIILGKTLHQAGFSQDCLRGQDFVSVDWYKGPGDMVGGLMKNVFAFYNFHVPTGIGAGLVIIGLSIFPYLGTVFGRGLLQGVCALIILLKLGCFLAVCKIMKAPAGSVLWAPAAPFILLFISVRAMLVTLYNDGIDWRGTHYPLALLRSIEPIVTIQWLLKF